MYFESTGIKILRGHWPLWCGWKNE